MADFKASVSRYLEKHGYPRIRLKAVLFDMDGVLFNSMPYHADAWNKVMARYGLHLSREEAFLHEGRTGSSTINIVYRRQFGKDADPELVKTIYDEKSAEFAKNPEPERMPGAWELLQKLKEEGIIPVIVTGSGQHSLFDRLSHCFPGTFQRERMVTAFDVKYGKPNPEPYLMGWKRRECNPMRPLWWRMPPSAYRRDVRQAFLRWRSIPARWTDKYCWMLVPMSCCRPCKRCVTVGRSCAGHWTGSKKGRRVVKAILFSFFITHAVKKHMKNILIPMNSVYLHVCKRHFDK